MIRRALTKMIGLAAMAAALSGCMVNETKPLPKLNPIQAQAQIPQDELLDVAVYVFDPGVPADAKDTEALEKKRIYPEIRQAESRFVATMVRSTLESSGQWGAVRVVPAGVEFVDVAVSGRILESTGRNLALQVTARDSTGRVWIDGKKYESQADTGVYKTDASLKARDPFQNVYSMIANDLLAAREKLAAADRREIRRVADLRFAADLAPQAMQGYLQKDDKGVLRVSRLPAANDPYAERIRRIRERDAAVVDTVNGYYSNFSDQMRESYGSWRRASFEEIEKEEQARASARTRTVLGAAAVLASVFVPNQCSSTDYNCQRIESYARAAGVIGGTTAVLSGLKKYSDVKVHTQALKELSDTFKSEVAPQVVDVEGRTLRLTGSAEEQYREWRQLLQQLYLEETGGGAQAAPAAAPVTAADAGAAPSRARGRDASTPVSPSTTSTPITAAGKDAAAQTPGQAEGPPATTP
jgi:hypothetical protein